MGSDGTYRDHIVIHAFAEMLSIQILILSSTTEANILIRPDGQNVFEPSEPYIVLGHLPENNGEHYVALGQDLADIVTVITRSPQIQLQKESKVDVTPLARVQPAVTPRSPMPAVQASEDVNENLLDLPVEILTIIFTMVIDNNFTIYEMLLEMQELYEFVSLYVTRPSPSLLSLPNHIVNNIVQLSLSEDILTFCMVRKMHELNFLINDVFIPRETIYMNAQLESTLNPHKLPLIRPSVRAISRASGKNSGLMIEIKRWLVSNSAWYNAWLVLLAEWNGWYVVSDISWKKY
jgi:hypothetical protein